MRVACRPGHQRGRSQYPRPVSPVQRPQFSTHLQGDLSGEALVKNSESAAAEILGREGQLVMKQLKLQPANLIVHKDRKIPPKSKKL